MLDSDNNGFRQAPSHKETKCGHLNHIPFGGTCRKPETTDVVVPTIGHLLFLCCLVLSTGKFPERY